MRGGAWPTTDEALIAEQLRLAAAARTTARWDPPPAGMVAGGCFLAYAQGQAGPGRPGDRAWAAAVLWRAPAGGPLRRHPYRALVGTGPSAPRRAHDVLAQAVVAGAVPAAYRPGLLALREGPLLEEAVGALPRRPDVLLVDATGRDHPRRAGLAVQLGSALQVPTVGVTRRPLVATGPAPALRRGESAPLVLDAEVVARWVCTRSGARPVVAHAGWRTDPSTAVAVVLACSGEASRTPVPLGEARRVARESRAVAEGRGGRAAPPDDPGRGASVGRREREG